jgi:phosphoribosylanthranilate isomerase
MLDSPVILAGGLTPSNVKSAVQTVAPFGVDVASGVEDTGGSKDHDAVEAFINRATRVDIDTSNEQKTVTKTDSTNDRSAGDSMDATTPERHT